MSQVFTPRSGVLENTTFGILSPDGKHNLVTPGRGPMHAFRDATSMANRMQLIALQHPGAKKSRWTDEQLPTLKSVDVALNVGACDNLPVLITFAQNHKRLAEINEVVLAAAWTEEAAGHFVYASTIDASKLKPIPGVKGSEGVLVVEPGPYGLSGKILWESSVVKSPNVVRDKLLETAASFARVAPQYTAHIQLGIQLGIDWESAIPETDQQSIRAKRRARGDF